MAQLSTNQFKEIHGKLASDGGFTVDPRTGDAVTSGISVAPMDNERVLAPGQSSPASIQSYHGEPGNQERFDRAKATKLGGWRGPDGSDYLDTPTVHPHTPGGGGLARARKQMVLSDQIAAFDLDSFDELPNPFHPGGREMQGKEPHELAGGSREGMSTEKRRKQAEWRAQQPEVQSWVNAPRRKY